MKVVFAFLLVFVVCTGMGIIADVLFKEPGRMQGIFTLIAGAVGFFAGIGAASSVEGENKK